MRSHVLALILLLLVGVAARLALYTSHSILWDAAAYIQMGQFLWSGGELGIWESIRPPLWPALLGAGWRAGLPIASFSQWLSMLFSIASILVLWDLVRRTVGLRVAWFSAILWSLSPILFYWGNFRYSEIPALFWMLLAFHRMRGGRYMAGGIFLSLALLTHFPLAAVVFAAIPALVRDATRRRLLRFGAGLAVPLALYAVALLVSGSHPLEPFSVGWEVSRSHGAAWGQSPLYYLGFLWQHESYLLALVPLGWWLLWRRRGPAIGTSLASSGILFLLFLSVTPDQAVRFVLPALPGLYFAVALALDALIQRTPKRGHAAATAVVVLLAVGVQIPAYQRMRFPEVQRDVFQSYVEQFREQLEGQRIWISSPTMLIGSELRAGRLLYYPIVNRRTLRRSTESLREADVVMIARNHLPCSPESDEECLRLREELFESLRSGFVAEWEELDAAAQVEAGIYRRVSR